MFELKEVNADAFQVYDQEGHIRIINQGEMRRPRRYDDLELLKAGVLITDPHRGWLQCVFCGRNWSPDLLPGGKMPQGYWRCTDGCNEDL